MELDKEKKINDKIDKKIHEAWNKALKDPFTSSKDIINFVYSK